MISGKATENLTGSSIEGNFNDFYELVGSIYRMVGFQNGYDDDYWGVKNRLLGLCYDIRHASMGGHPSNTRYAGAGGWGAGPAS